MFAFRLDLIAENTHNRPLRCSTGPGDDSCSAPGGRTVNRSCCSRTYPHTALQGGRNAQFYRLPREVVPEAPVVDRGGTAFRVFGRSHDPEILRQVFTGLDQHSGLLKLAATATTASSTARPDRADDPGRVADEGSLCRRAEGGTGGVRRPDRQRRGVVPPVHRWPCLPARAAWRRRWGLPADLRPSRRPVRRPLPVGAGGALSLHEHLRVHPEAACPSARPGARPGRARPARKRAWSSARLERRCSPTATAASRSDSDGTERGRDADGTCSVRRGHPLGGRPLGHGAPAAHRPGSCRGFPGWRPRPPGRPGHVDECRRGPPLQAPRPEAAHAECNREYPGWRHPARATRFGSTTPGAARTWLSARSGNAPDRRPRRCPRSAATARPPSAVRSTASPCRPGR